MNKNNHDNNTEAVKIANALKPFAKKWFDEWGKSCLRSKKMTVSTAPNGTVIGVKDAFSDTEMFVKYMAECSSAQVGDTVWCKWMYDNMQTLYADSMGDISEKNVEFNNVTVDSVLDVTKRRCYAALSSAGWYRVMIADYPSAETGFMRGKAAPLIRFGISRKGDAVTSETHEILLMSGGWDAIKFVDEKSACASLLIDKIRYTYNSSNSKAYVDIHYNSSGSNAVGVTLAVTAPTFAIFGQIKAASLEAVADAPSGETILATYDFSANGIRTVTLTAANSSVTINRQKCVRSWNVVSLWVDFTLSEAISGYGFLINSPTFASDANALVYNASSTLQTNVRLYADAENSGLRCYGAFPAGRYVAFVTYITTDV